jgi:hypothetical protein
LPSQSNKPGVNGYRLDIDGELPLATLIASRLTELEMSASDPKQPVSESALELLGVPG